MIARLDLAIMEESADGEPTGSSLRAALEQNGAAYLVNHGVPAAVIEGAYRACSQIHELDRGSKEAVAVGSNGFARGWHEGRRAGKGAYETFEIGPPPDANDPEDATGILHGPNVWPACGGFREATEEYFAAMVSLSHTLLPLMEQAFALPAGYLVARTRAPCSILRMLRYEASTEPVAGIDPHTDFELLTILSEDGSGLELCDREGAWRPLRTSNRGELILLAGDLLEILTAGRVESPLHRVAMGQAERRSLAFFCGLDIASEIAPVSHLEASPGGRAYGPVHIGEHLAAMYVLSYPHLRTAHEAGRLRLPGIAVPANNPFKQYKLERSATSR